MLGGERRVDEGTSGQPWLVFRVAGDTGAGVDARALARLLTDIVGAARIIARERLSLDARSGPMTSDERALAGFRVTSVTPGSVNIAFAAPSEQQSVMALDEERTPAAIARALMEEFETASRAQPPDSEGRSRRRAVERVVRSAARIGTSAEIEHRPADGTTMRVDFSLSSETVAYEAVPELPNSRERVMFGQVFMADVEDGRQRVRVKLADASDVTIRLQEHLAGSMSGVLGRLAELRVGETLIGETVERMVVGVRPLTAEERGVELPPKSIDDLAREQGLLWREHPDYVSILSGLWESEEEAEAFREYIQSGRTAP